MKQYQDLLRHVMTHGVNKSDRTGTGTRSVFGYQCKYDLNDGFPLVTTKKVHLKSIIHELLWMLSGKTDLKYLQDNGVTIWDSWTVGDGTIGRGYGAQWRAWSNYVKKIVGIGHGLESKYVNKPIDQISWLINEIKTNPDSRRLIVTAWNPAELDQMALPPCHCFFQFYVADGKLSCQLYQRSGDIFLGIPFNIASYSLLTMMVAQVCDLELGEFIHTIGDAHAYKNHFDQIELQLSREPLPLPQMILNKNIDNIFDFTYDDFELKNYQPHPAIKAPVAV